MACRNIRIRKVLDLHENVPEIMKYYHHVRKFPGKFLIFPSVWKKWERRLVDRFDKTVVVTEEAKHDLVEEYHTDPGKIIVVPNSVQPVFYSVYSIDKTVTEKFAADFVMLYFGDTGLRRGLETSIMAMPALAEKIPNIKLVIVGKSKSDPELKRLAIKMGADKHISFEGFQDEKLLQSYILSSHICISPLLRNKHHDTTFANKLFQYMALGKPILASDCTAQKRIVLEADSGIIHEAGNVKDFTEMALLLYRDDRLRNRLGDNGKNFIHFTYNQQLKSRDLISFYGEMNRYKTENKEAENNHKSF
jgi:glycosyltransferase involved in cell wall biosynthesis